MGPVTEKNDSSSSVAPEQALPRMEVFGVQRPADKTVALYPHCSRGRARHFKNAAWWWSFGLGAFNLFNMTLPYAYINGFSQPFDVVFLQVFAAVMLFYGVMTFSISHKWMPFVRLADKAFRALELPGPSNVDLVKSSNQQRTERDPGEFGTFSFRY